jgi:hypothetical protein
VLRNFTTTTVGWIDWMRAFSEQPLGWISKFTPSRNIAGRGILSCRLLLVLSEKFLA